MIGETPPHRVGRCPAKPDGGATWVKKDILKRFFGIVAVMRRQLGWLGILALAALTPFQTVNASAPPFMPAMQAASQARQVPLPLIEAITYVNSRWEWIGTTASDGGVGPMHLMPKQMAQAAGLSGHSQAEIATDLSSNLDAR